MEAPVLMPPRREDDPQAYEDFYHEHAQDYVPKGDAHFQVVHYFADAIQSHKPGCWVAGDLECYWGEDDAPDRIVADLALIDGPRPSLAPVPISSYTVGAHGALRFVVDVISPDSPEGERWPNQVALALGFRPDEYLFLDFERRRLYLYRLNGDLYQPVSPDPRGWLYSQMLGLWFGMEPDGWVWLYTRDGDRCLRHDESESRRREAEARVTALEARVAELERRLVEQSRGSE